MSTLQGRFLGTAVMVLAVAASFARMAVFPSPGRNATVLMAVIVYAVALGGSVWAWRHQDEVSQAAQRFAWFWGGLAGSLVGGIAVVWITSPGIELVREGLAGATTPAAFVALGAMGMLLLQFAGYLFVWACWWLARR